MDTVLVNYYSKLRVSGIDEKLVKIKKDSKGYVLKYVDFNYPLDIFKIPSFIYKLEDACFSGTKFKRVVIDENVNDIGSNCFANCNSLEEILIRDSHKDFIVSLRESNNAKVIVMRT